ncbi:MAG: dihydroxyacetone kinase family protein [Austwickia sp.]|nr:dihydroxyacetone kinase family protein [Actinomycetota bacterium]MCB1251973.1 dihydroxyacetone kinase family protein [Austwickia sp.]MCO5308074.1 dihydroxyacetone kinase family protein [Austwickia sp.]
MTFLVNAPSDFADQALAGLVAAHPRYLRAVHGGVVRSTVVPQGQVGLVIGGGTGHYPAFAGWVGPGIAHGSACGNIFASPSASQIYSVLKACDHGAGVFVSFGNYAGDVLHFGQAAEKLRGEGVDVRIVTVTDDIASAPPQRAAERRGIAGDLAVFKCAGAAAEEGADLDAVERIAVHANDRTRTFGVAFAGCTLPGADHPLFTVPEGQMSLGLGIHGEPGIADVPLGTADEIAALLVEKVLAEDPGDSKRVVALLNGLGTVKYEELYLTYGTVARLLGEHGYTVVDAEVGEQCTSLDMAGLSLTLLWLDDELERLWTAPCDTPAYRKGVVGEREIDRTARAEDTQDDIAPGSAASQALAGRIATGVSAVHALLQEIEPYLGDIDAIAGDGDHGIGMLRGAAAGDAAAAELLTRQAGARTLLERVGAAWAERSGGTSGALWGAAIEAAAAQLDDQDVAAAQDAREVAVAAAVAAVHAILQLGKAQVGEKTMVDAAVPFRDALQSTPGPLPQVWAAAVTAATTGAEATKDYSAKRGRAKTHQDKSIGTPDPGAVSFARIVAVVGEHLPG